MESDKQPIPFPPPPLAPGQIEVKLGAKRYVLNVPEGEGEPVLLVDDRDVEVRLALVRAAKPNISTFALVSPPVGEEPKP